MYRRKAELGQYFGLVKALSFLAGLYVITTGRTSRKDVSDTGWEGIWVLIYRREGPNPETENYRTKSLLYAVEPLRSDGLILHWIFSMLIVPFCLYFLYTISKYPWKRKRGKGEGGFESQALVVEGPMYFPCWE